jgi:hypothetical protein
MPGFTQIPNDEVFNDPLWTSDRFTKGQALVDLYKLAQYQDGITQKRGIIIPLKPGQLGWSLDSLAERWQWSKGKVRRFFHYLKTVGQIELQKTNVSTTITLLHWINNDTPNRPADSPQTVPQTARRRDPNNIVNKDNTVNTVNNSDLGETKVSLIRIFGDEYKRCVGIEYHASFGKDGKVLKALQNHFGRAHVIEGIKYFFRVHLKKDRFARKNPNVGMLQNVWNGMVASATEESRRQRDIEDWVNE